MLDETAASARALLLEQAARARGGGVAEVAARGAEIQAAVASLVAQLMAAQAKAAAEAAEAAEAEELKHSTGASEARKDI